MPPVLHPNICLEESFFNEVLCKLQNYITIINQYLKGLIIGIETLELGRGGTWKFKSLGSSGRNFCRCLLATLLRSPGSGLLASGSLKSQFSTMISSTMVLAALKMFALPAFSPIKRKINAWIWLFSVCWVKVKFYRSVNNETYISRDHSCNVGSWFGRVVVELMSRQEVVPLLDDCSLTSVLLGSYRAPPICWFSTLQLKNTHAYTITLVW